MIGSLPAGKAELLTEAVPLTRVGAPRVIEPLTNVTVPVVFVGRVAVKVTD